MKKRALSLVLVLASLLAMVPAAYAADYTFTDRYGDERTVKDGEYSFATRVVEFTPGSPWTKMEPEQDPNSTLGKPDYVEGSSDYTNLCLGAGGVLVLGLGCQNLTMDQFKAELGEWGRAEALTRQVYEDWQSRHFYLHTTMRHSDTDQVLRGFRTVLEYVRLQEPDQYNAANADLIAQLELLAEMEQAAVVNVL